MAEPSLFDFARLDAGNDREAALAGQFRLARVQLMNWGTFHNLNTIEVARKGHLITGESGSGKSSLLDGIATVLTPGRWLRYNQAAQDAGTKKGDRSLMSYLRGAWGKDEDTTEQRTVSRYLRRSAVWGGVLLRFDTDDGRSFSAARVFHVKGASTDKADVRDLSFAVEEEVGLAQLAPYIAGGVDSRGAKKAWPEAVIATGGNSAVYFNRLRRVLGIPEEAGLQLLHRTQAAKNLGSLDRLFRDYMLDEPESYSQATTAVEQFVDLKEAHRLVAQARRQLEALEHLGEAASAYEEAESELERLEVLAASLNLYSDTRLLEVHRRELERLQELSAGAEAQSATLSRALEEAAAASRRAALQADRDGGAALAQATSDLAQAKRDLVRVQEDAERLSADLRAVGIESPRSAVDFAELQVSARDELASPSPASAVHASELVGRLHATRAELADKEKELAAAVKAPRSNMPRQLLAVREELAQALGLQDFELPFAGELIDIDPAHAEWSGAIERVLAPLATTLLVRSDQLPAVRRLVQGKHLGARLRFEEVPAHTAVPGSVGADSLVHRVKVVESVFSPWLQARLSAHFDYTCVESVDALEGVDRGVTVTGLVKSRMRSYIKDDRFALNDRRRWLLGSSNEERVNVLLGERQELQARTRAAEEAAGKEARAANLADRRRFRLESVVTLEWSRYDVVEAGERVARHQAEQDRLTGGNRDLQEALRAQREAEKAEAALRVEHTAAQRAAAEAASRERESKRAVAEVGSRVGGRKVDPEVASELGERFGSGQRRLAANELIEATRRVDTDLRLQSNRAKTRSEAASSTFAARATAFRTEFTELGANRTTEVADRAGYRELHREIYSRGLPRFEQRFRELLQGRPVQLVGVLLDTLRGAGREVRERIDPVNVSLRRAPFDRGRTLEILVRERHTSEVSAFMQELTQVVSGSWAVGDGTSPEADEARFTLLDSIMGRLGSGVPADVAWRERVLNTREHVSFLAQEKDKDGVVHNVYESSAGLSGGQRQKLVVFCLAAALRYQLAPDPDTPPRYGTVILDEAFDKADAKYTRAALEVFREFGFHLVLATPQKLLSVIEPYIGALTVVSNPDHDQSSLSPVDFSGRDSGARERIAQGSGARAAGRAAAQVEI